jgi:hypothetical protein
MSRLIVFIFLFFSLQAWGQDLDSAIDQFMPFIRALHNFTGQIPREKVYLHFDNTGYYRGDHICFKCYVVTSGQHRLSGLSKTLYVELLNPGGEAVDRRILKIENGQCHGDFTLNQLSFYSGFYEVRAYTKYMLDFGDDVIFSRLLPVFDKPKIDGNFEEKNMIRYGTGNYPMKREKPLREKKVNLRFFPTWESVDDMSFIKSFRGEKGKNPVREGVLSPICYILYRLALIVTVFVAVALIKIKARYCPSAVSTHSPPSATILTAFEVAWL